MSSREGRKALVIGIDHYVDERTNLAGAVNDAREVFGLLDRHEDRRKNFDVELLISEPQNLISRANLRNKVQECFAGRGHLALLYFAGHGYTEDTGGYICPSDSITGDDGLSLSDIMLWANNSEFENRVVILDSCYSGAAASRNTQRRISELSEGVTILAASTEYQTAAEVKGGGVFTNLLVDALHGAAANLVGEVTPGAVYAHVDQSLARWGQRPVFKTNVQSFVSLRETQPPINPDYLRRIAEFFPSPNFYYQLDYSFEPERTDAERADPNVLAPNPVKNATLAVFQEYNRVGLLKPEGHRHLWHAARFNGGAKLTRLGEHYRQLALKGLL